MDRIFVLAEKTWRCMIRVGKFPSRPLGNSGLAWAILFPPVL